MKKVLKRLHLLSLIIPVGVLVSSAFLPSQSPLRQVFILIMLVWFGTEVMTGFNFS